MISVEGAAVIAQVFPVGILVIALEISRVETILAASRTAFAMLVVFALGLIVTLVLGLDAVQICIRAVSTDKPVTGAEAVIVGIAGQLLIAAVGTLLTLLILQRFEVMDRLASWGRRRRGDDPEGELRMFDAIEHFHPNATRLSPEARAVLEGRATAAREAREAAEAPPPIPRPPAGQSPTPGDE